MKYLSEELVRDSFLRLRETDNKGKKGLERTSALMCFLAFDALLKRTGLEAPIDLDSENSVGKNNRDGLTSEFRRLVLVKSNGTKTCQVSNLGAIVIGGPTPEKRFSANFLTVSLKKATTSSKPCGYPSRPKPLLALGSEATGLVWGINRHESWKDNLPTFLSERNTKTPFHDLACFVLKQRGFYSEGSSLQEGLIDGLKEVFTNELCEYWKAKLSLERPYLTAVDNPFQDKTSLAFDDCSWAECEIDENSILTERIVYLEGLLKMNHIKFE